MSWPPPRHQLPRAESRPTARRCRVLLPLLLLGGYLFVSLSLKSRVLASEPSIVVDVVYACLAGAVPIACRYPGVAVLAPRRSTTATRP